MEATCTAYAVEPELQQFIQIREIKSVSKLLSTRRHLPAHAKESVLVPLTRAERTRFQPVSEQVEPHFALGYNVTRKIAGVEFVRDLRSS